MPSTASIIWKVLVPELGADIEAHFGSQQALQIADPQSLSPDGVALPLTTLLALSHVILDDRVAADEPAFVAKPVEHPLGRVACKRQGDPM